MAVLTRKRTETVSVPKHGLEDFVEYRQAVEKLDDLRRRQSTLTQNIADELDRLGNTTAAAARLKDLAAKLIETGEIADDRPDRVDLDKLRHSLRVVEEAISLQEQAVEDTRRRLSSEIRQAVLPRHQSIAGRMAAALRDLKSAIEDERSVVCGLEDQRIGIGDPLQCITFVVGNGGREQTLEAIQTWLDDNYSYYEGVEQ